MDGLRSFAKDGFRSGTNFNVDISLSHSDVSREEFEYIVKECNDFRSLEERKLIQLKIEASDVPELSRFNLVLRFKYL